MRSFVLSAVLALLAVLQLADAYVASGALSLTMQRAGSRRGTAKPAGVPAYIKPAGRGNARKPMPVNKGLTSSGPIGQQVPKPSGPIGQQVRAATPKPAARGPVSKPAAAPRGTARAPAAAPKPAGGGFSLPNPFAGKSAPAPAAPKAAPAPSPRQQKAAPAPAAPKEELVLGFSELPPGSPVYPNLLKPLPKVSEPEPEADYDVLPAGNRAAAAPKAQPKTGTQRAPARTPRAPVSPVGLGTQPVPKKSGPFGGLFGK